MREVVKIPMNLYRITLVKLVNGTGPALYRLTNVNTLDYDVIAASDIFDRIINDGWKIENLGSRHGSLFIIDGDGYESNRDVVITDEFSKSQTLFDYCTEMHNGSEILKSFNAVRNRVSLDRVKVDSNSKYYWTCSKGHTIYCDVPTYISRGGECPFCASEKTGMVHSFYTWAKYTDNNQLLLEYNIGQDNRPADEIPYTFKGKAFIKDERVSLHDMINSICKDELAKLGECNGRKTKN